MDRASPAVAEDAVRLREGALGLLRGMPELAEAEAVGLCGSVARGTATPASDVDVVVVLPDGRGSDREEDRWGRAVRRALGPLGRDVSVLVYTPSAIRRVANWYVLRLASDAVLAHDREGATAGLLARVRATARQRGFVERQLDGRPYWEYAGDASRGWSLELEGE